MVNAQFSDQVKTEDTSRLINGISRVLQKLLKYFHGTAIVTFYFSVLLACNVPVTLVS